MPKLNIAHHKSYHPYRADNIERVRRDEERAAAEEAGDKARVMQADAEARIAMLRKKSRKGKSKEEDEAMMALDRQLKGKGRVNEDDDNQGSSSQSLRNGQTDDHSTITTDRGHFNFWADLERGKPGASTKTRGNAEYEAEKKAADQKWEDQITMYLKAPPKSWYDSQDRLTNSERRMTQDQRLEHTYKDNQLKRVEDPLATMQAYLKRRDEVKAAQERQRADPWADTPRTLKSDRTPVQASRLRSRRRSPSPAGPTAGPERPPKQQSHDNDLHAAAVSREASERERARALRAAKAAKSGNSTPGTEFGYQTGMYNKSATRQAKGYSNVRW